MLQFETLPALPRELPEEPGEIRFDWDELLGRAEPEFFDIQAQAGHAKAPRLRCALGVLYWKLAIQAEIEFAVRASSKLVRPGVRGLLPRPRILPLLQNIPINKFSLRSHRALHGWLLALAALLSFCRLCIVPGALRGSVF